MPRFSLSSPPHARSRSIAAAAATSTLVLAALMVPSTQASAATVTILDHSVKPAIAVAKDNAGVELGLRFTSSRAGTISAIQFYRTSAEKAAYQGTLWSAGGKRLATAEFPRSTAVGWQSAPLSASIRVTAGEALVASYFTPTGGYPATHSAFNHSISRNGFTIPANGGVFRYGSSSGFPTHSWLGTNYFVDVVFHPAVTPRPPSSPPPTSGGSPSGNFPSADNTGVPTGTKLTPYEGPCTITAAGTVIDAKTVECSLTIRATGVVISRSRIDGSIANGSDAATFTIRDSNVNAGDGPGTGIGNSNYTALRVQVTGGNRSMNCDSNCTITDSYVHGQFRDSSGTYHESGIRMGQNTVLRHNTILCDAPDVAPSAACSADLTGYGDFAVVEQNLIDDNLFKATTGGYCAYGGSTQGKPYSAGVNNIRFIDNIFERGKNGTCGVWGPIASFDSSAPGNVWSGNIWDDGATVPAG